MPIFEKNNGDGMIVRLSSEKLAKKSEKSRNLSKFHKLKSKKLAKSKKPSKSWNSSKFNVEETGLSFLTPNTKMVFNCLYLAFIEALILWHFNSECHI